MLCYFLSLEKAPKATALQLPDRKASFLCQHELQNLCFATAKERAL